MAVATAAVGLVPSYAAIGIAAPVIVVTLFWLPETSGKELD